MKIYELYDENDKLVGSLTEYTVNDDGTDYVVLYLFYDEDEDKKRKPIIYRNMKVFNKHHNYKLEHVSTLFI